MSEPKLRVEPIRPGVSAVVLNRPGCRNALSIALMKELCAAIDRLSADPAQRVLLLRGEGPAFCAGMDLREASNVEAAEQGAEWVGRVFSSLRSTPLVTIGEAHGAAMAGGAGLLLACDFAIAADDLRLGFPEVRRGLVPALVAQILRHRLRDGDLRELLLLAEPIDARRALRMGLVHRVVPANQVRDEALRFANLLLQGGPLAILATKQLLADLQMSPESEGPQIARRYHLEARLRDEAREGLAAFLEKRGARWT
jgi:methylglutaconyl-CoA hydratase